MYLHKSIPNAGDKAVTTYLMSEDWNSIGFIDGLKIKLKKKIRKNNPEYDGCENG